MCGIGCTCTSSSSAFSFSTLFSLLTKRGPDVQSSVIAMEENFFKVGLTGHVLQMKGEITKQPICNEKICLLWNGEIFRGIDMDEKENDTQALFHQLQLGVSAEMLSDLFSDIHGPFAFIICDVLNKEIYFGRDQIGRRSLVSWGIPDFILQNALTNGIHGSDSLVSTWPREEFCISSVSGLSEMINPLDVSNSLSWVEIPPVGIYKIKFVGNELQLCMTPWSRPLFPIRDIDYLYKVLAGKDNDEDIEEVESDPLFSYPSILTTVRDNPPLDFSSAVDGFLNVLSLAIKSQIIGLSEGANKVINIFFSGGIDCVVLALLSSRYVNSGCKIELTNVAFGPALNEHSESALDYYIEEKCDVHPFSSVWNVPDRLAAINALAELREIDSSSNYILNECNIPLPLLLLHEDNILRLIYPLKTIMDFNIGSVLYFAAVGHGFVFKKPRDFCAHEDVRYYRKDIDFKLARRESEQKRSEAMKLKSNKIFEEVLEFKDDYIPYKTESRVCFIGLGADEILGGYTRHRAIWNKMGSNFVRKELIMDIAKLWRRNLGRDDRVVSNFSCEARHPYLDEDLLKYVFQLPIDFVCNLKEPPGCGDKKILRAASERLGLNQTALLEKRAMQFGTRIANKSVSGEIVMDLSTDRKFVVHPKLVNPLQTGGKSKLPKELVKGPKK